MYARMRVSMIPNIQVYVSSLIERTELNPYYEMARAGESFPQLSNSHLIVTCWVCERHSHHILIMLGKGVAIPSDSRYLFE